jgi:hypothetical protein
VLFYVDFCLKTIHKELFLNKNFKEKQLYDKRTINSRPAETQKQKKFLGMIGRAGKR